MDKSKLERQGYDLLRSLNEYQLRYIIALAEKMFAKSRLEVVKNGTN